MNRANDYLIAAEAYVEAAWRHASATLGHLLGLTRLQSAFAQFAIVVLALTALNAFLRSRDRRRHRRAVDAEVSGTKASTYARVAAHGASSYDIRYQYGRPQVAVSIHFDGFIATGEALDATYASAVRLAVDAAIRSAGTILGDRGARRSQVEAPRTQTVRAPPPDRYADDSPWWVVLGVDKTAASTEVKVAYRNLAKKWHPDAGGSSAIMTRVIRARNQALRGAD